MKYGFEKFDNFPESLKIKIKKISKGNGKIKGSGFGDDIWNWVKNAARKVWNTLKSIWQGLTDFLAGFGLTPGETLIMLGNLAGQTRFAGYTQYLVGAGTFMKILEKNPNAYGPAVIEAQSAAQAEQDKLGSKAIVPPKKTKKGKGTLGELILGKGYIQDINELNNCRKKVEKFKKENPGTAAAMGLGKKKGKGKTLGSFLKGGAKGDCTINGIDCDEYQRRLDAKKAKAAAESAKVPPPEGTINGRPIKKGDGFSDLLAAPNASVMEGSGRRKKVRFPIEDPNNYLSKGTERGAHSGFAAIQQSPNSNSFAVVAY